MWLQVFDAEREGVPLHMLHRLHTNPNGLRVYLSVGANLICGERREKTTMKGHVNGRQRGRYTVHVVQRQCL